MLKSILPTSIFNKIYQNDTFESNFQFLLINLTKISPYIYLATYKMPIFNKIPHKQ